MRGRERESLLSSLSSHHIPLCVQRRRAGRSAAVAPDMIELYSGRTPRGAEGRGGPSVPGGGAGRGAGTT